MSPEHSRLPRAVARLLWTVPLLLAACRPVAPAASVTRQPPPSRCPPSDGKWQERKRERQAEITRLQGELQQQPNDAARWAALGKAYGSEDGRNAIDALQRATRLAPNSAAYWQQL